MFYILVIKPLSLFYYFPGFGQIPTHKKTEGKQLTSAWNDRKQPKLPAFWLPYCLFLFRFFGFGKLDQTVNLILREWPGQATLQVLQ